MSTLFQAPQFDPEREKHRRNIVIVIIVIVVILGALAWAFRYWPQEHQINQFFTALEQKDYERAYGIYMHDPNWKQHEQQYASKYSFHDFYVDWGPGGEWGLIRSHRIDAAGKPKGGGSGIIVEVTINDRKVPARMWVDNDKTITVYPY